jgi:plasmid stabilization system protein ParE
VNGRRVRFTAIAEKHIENKRAWWRKNRDNHEIFELELDQAIAQISALPGTGTGYPLAKIPGLRRIYLRKIDCHLYYTADDQTILVQAVWGARRQRGPRL